MRTIPDGPCPPPPLAPPSHPPLPQEIRRVWVGYATNADAGMGQRLAAKLAAASAL